jgi:hypothetical protein
MTASTATADKGPAAPQGALDTATTPLEPAKRPPLNLKRGTRIQLGPRKGTVKEVRGSWKKPYDLRVVWDGEKYPQYLIYQTLELDYEQGNLKVLDGESGKSGKGT